MTLSPIALFVYNRLEHTQKTVEALQKNFLAKESELFIFSDGAKNESDKEKIQKVREYAKNISGFKSVNITERENNIGLANSIISGVTEIVNKYEKIIVLEDDLVTSPYFLEYMNKSLELYKNEEDVISIHGYIYPVKKELPETFFIKGADCWGWATWKRGWSLFEKDGGKLLMDLKKNNLIKEFNFNNSFNFSGMLERQINGLNNSWAIRWYASAFLANKLTLYPGHSLIQNIGQDGTGTHKGNSTAYQTHTTNKRINIGNIKITENIAAKEAIILFFNSRKTNIIKKIKSKISKLFK